MAEVKTSSRPLPSGWSDSSDDGNPNGAPAAAGRGFDDSSSDGDWGGGEPTGGGIRQFERSSAENTRRALLHNDEQLCEPPSWSSRRDPGALHTGDSGRQEGGGKEHEPLPSPPPPPPTPLRYVPGDPFANEEADVGAWAEHFTYLSVVPAGEGGAGGAKDCSGGGGGGFSESGSMSINRAADAERSLPVVGAPDVTEMEEEREDEAGGGDAAIKRCTEGGGARAQGVAAAAAAAVALEAAGDNRPSGERQRESPQEEGEEEVFASHGVYEECLAYDCRPPDYTHSDHLESTGGGSDAGVGGQGGSGVAYFVDVVEEGARAGGAAGRPPPGATRGIPRLDTPRRELRQEIMDRLFDELWARLTPDILLLLQQEEQQPRDIADVVNRGVEMGEEMEEQGTGFRLKVPRDSMEY